MRVVGTAGHVDHGKSTLIRALTGIDPDRLQEEKDRGMTIDLGFAWLKLPNGQEISIVDVPGHERFIHNMLAGVGGIDAALLVVAADESIMPQTREHLAILDLLGVENGVVALTKRDLVDEEWLDLVKTEVEETLAETSLRGAPLVAVSSTTGEGLDELRRTIQDLLTRERTRRVTGKPRLPVDRVFTIAGFGTVVTGTLLDGQLDVGQEVELQPSGRRTRIRGLQSHKKKVQSVPAGTRVAVNLAGLSKEQIERGDVLTSPGWLRPTRLLDARLRVITDAPRPLVQNTLVTFHTGAAEALAKVNILDVPEIAPGDEAWVQLRLQSELAVSKGDQFILRLPSPSATVGGGAIVEPHPRRHRRFQERVINQLAVLEQGSPEEILLEQLALREPSDLESLTRRSGLAPDEAKATVSRMIEQGEIVALDNQKGNPVNATPLISKTGWTRLVGQVARTLEQFHRAQPLRRGMPKEEVRTRLGIDARLFPRVLQRLLAERAVAEVGPLLKLPPHEVVLNDAQRQQVEELMAWLTEAGASPPSRDEFEHELGLAPEVTQVLLDEGRLIEVSPDLLYPPHVRQQMVDAVVAQIKEQGSITVAGARDLFDTSRKYALALMAHLDERRITRRVGDERVLA
ncbi:MAG: selenocysteine-specific translation elongation factor [Chloroflexi bacterium]|nr:selenocysteine-specific translation elongation factor [Chloroflexota bacterium]